MEDKVIADVVSALRKVPAVHLNLIDLLPELVNEAGLDFNKVAARQKEVDLAIAEAKAYSEETQKAIHMLSKIGVAETVDPDDDEYNPYEDVYLDEDEDE